MRIGVLGIGKLGLCFALNLENRGYYVTGVDILEDYVKSINEKTFISLEPGVNQLLQNSKTLYATTNLNNVLSNDYGLLFIMAATPSNADGTYNHSQIEGIVESLIKQGKRNFRVDIVIGCTVMPGYTTQLNARLNQYNYFVSYNPEFIAQGSILRDQIHPDQVLIGEYDSDIGDKLETLYSILCINKPVICRMDPLSAEITKLATNCFLTMKISFANSIGDLALKAGAHPEKILSAVGADLRIGAAFLKHGFGFGGPCLPRDNRALGFFAESLNHQLYLSKAADLVNDEHLAFQVNEYLLGFPPEKAIVFNSVTYKPGTGILENSQPLALAVELAKHGRKVVIKEQPHIIEQLVKLYGGLFSYESLS
jgi:nucleotide sugar dehydrogenase